MASQRVTIQEHLAGVDEWGDDACMHALFKAMPSKREVSPAAYDCKDRFWAALILSSQEAVYRGEAFTVTELQRRFTRNGVHPLCLEQVVLLMLHRKELVHGRILQQEAVAVESKAVTKAMWGIVGFLYKGSADPAKNLADAPLYVTSTLRSQSKVLLTELNRGSTSKMIDCLATPDAVASAYDRAVESQRGTGSMAPREVLLSLLITQGNVRQVMGDNGRVLGIKFEPVLEGSGRQSSGWLSVGVSLFSGGKKTLATCTQDAEILTVKAALESTKALQEQLSSKVNECKASALQFHKNGDKRTALLFMKRMKLHQEACFKQTQMLYTLEDIIMALGTAETDIQVHEAVKAGTASLKSILSGLDVEEVENAMDELKDVMESQETIQDAIAAPGLEDDVEMEELEAELSGIIAEQQKEMEEKEDAHALAEQMAALSVATHAPLQESTAQLSSPIAEAGC